MRRATDVLNGSPPKILRIQRIFSQGARTTAQPTQTTSERRSERPMARTLQDSHTMLPGPPLSMNTPTRLLDVLYYDAEGPNHEMVTNLGLDECVTVTHVDKLLPTRVALRSGRTGILLCPLRSDDTTLDRVFAAAVQDAPEVLRLVLCEKDDDLSELVRLHPYVHQFVPVGTPHCRGLIQRAIAAQQLMSHTPTRQIVGTSNALPSAPRIYRQLLEALRDPHVTNLKIAEVVEQDLGITSRLVQLVSSALFGLPRQVSSLGGCVAYLGASTVKNLVLAAEIEQTFQPNSIAGFSPEQLHKHAFTTARIAKRVAQGTGFEDDAFISALFHAVGQLVLATRSPVRFGRAIQMSSRDNIPLSDAETTIFGTTHAHVGAYLLGAWGLPLSVVEAVLYHDCPQLLDDRAFSIATAVYIAQGLALDVNVEVLSEAPPSTNNWLDGPFLEKVGAASGIDSWREFASGA